MTDTPAIIRLEPRARVILTVLLISCFVVFLNETILGVALPDIMSQLNIEASTGQWLSTVYMLTMAIVIPLTGFLLQRFTSRVVYVAAMSLFSVGTLLAAASPTFSFLLVGRILQAGGTALMMPLTMTSIMTLVPGSIRGKIMGTVSVVMSLAPALGPAISGLILSVFDWRWIFWLVLPIAVIVGVLGALRMPHERSPERPSLDKWSVVLSALAFSGIVYGLSNFAEAARGNALVSPYVPLGLGIVLGVLFVWRQIRLAHDDKALLDLRPFRSRVYVASIVLMSMAMVMLFGLSILTPIFAQEVLGMSPLVTGIFLLPGGLLMGFMGPLVGRLYDRYGARRLLVPGAVMTSASIWFMVSFSQSTPPWFILMSNLAISLGLAFLFTPLYTVSMSSVPERFYSHSSAIIGTTQQLAGAAGTALFVTVLTVVQVAALRDGATVVSANADGMRAAFLCGALASIVVIVLATMIRKPADAAEMARELDP